MTDKHFFADVDLPFHVWVREGNRWVLREAPQARGAEAPARQAAAIQAARPRGEPRPS